MGNESHYRCGCDVQVNAFPSRWEIVDTRPVLATYECRCGDLIGKSLYVGWRLLDALWSSKSFRNARRLFFRFSLRVSVNKNPHLCGGLSRRFDAL